MQKKQPIITIRNHNGVIVYQGNCFVAAAKEARQYTHQTGNATTTQTEWK